MNDADPDRRLELSWIVPGGGFDQVHPMPQRLTGSGFPLNELSNPLLGYDPQGLGSHNGHRGSSGVPRARASKPRVSDPQHSTTDTTIFSMDC
jgi:hypothetical protein